MKILLSVAFIILLSLVSYHVKSSEITDIIEHEIVGKWIMDDVYLAGDNILKKTIPEKSQWVTFSPNGQFLSGGKDFKLSFGEWVLDKEKATLFMVTNAGEKSSWKIKLSGNMLEWNGIGNAGQQDFKFIFKKDWMNP